VSVSTYVPATKPTPSTIEAAVRSSRSFFANRPFRAARHIG